jgi:hypothetical protein
MSVPEVPGPSRHAPTRRLVLGRMESTVTVARIIDGNLLTTVYSSTVQHYMTCLMPQEHRNRDHRCQMVHALLRQVSASERFKHSICPSAFIILSPGPKSAVPSNSLHFIFPSSFSKVFDKSQPPTHPLYYSPLTDSNPQAS